MGGHAHPQFGTLSLILSTSYSPNGLGNVTAQSSPDTGTSTFTFDPTGNILTSLGAPSTGYGYDANGYINAIGVNPVNANGSGQSGTSQALWGTISYNAENKVTGWLWSDGKARVIGYDSTGMGSSYALGDPMGLLLTFAGCLGGALLWLIAFPGENSDR
jgi:hypothetical protein